MLRGDGADGEEDIAARENQEFAVFRLTGCGVCEEGFGVGVGMDAGLGLGVSAMGWGVDGPSSDAEELAVGVEASGVVVDMLGSSKRRMGAGIGSGTGAGRGSSTNAGARSTAGSAGRNPASLDAEAPIPVVDNCACKPVVAALAVSRLFLNKSSALSCFPFPFPFIVPDAPNSGSAKTRLSDGTLLGSCCCVLELVDGESTLVVDLDLELLPFFGTGKPDTDIEELEDM